MYADAAQALGRIGGREEAVLVLERGRAVLLSQALDRDRGAVERLARRPDTAQLAARYTRAAARFRGLTAVPPRR